MTAAASRTAGVGDAGYRRGHAPQGAPGDVGRTGKADETDPRGEVGRMGAEFHLAPRSFDPRRRGGQRAHGRPTPFPSRRWRRPGRCSDLPVDGEGRGPEPGVATQGRAARRAAPIASERRAPRAHAIVPSAGRTSSGVLAREVQGIGQFRKRGHGQEQSEAGHARRPPLLHPICQAGSGRTLALDGTLHAVQSGPTEERRDRRRRGRPTGEDQSLGREVGSISA